MSIKKVLLSCTAALAFISTTSFAGYDPNALNPACGSAAYDQAHKQCMVQCQATSPEPWSTKDAANFKSCYRSCTKAVHETICRNPDVYPTQRNSQPAP
jgi:hypothetical protein